MQTCVAFLTGKQCFSDKLSIECDVCVRDILVENLVPPAETQIIQVTIAFKIKKTCANFLYWLFFGCSGHAERLRYETIIRYNVANSRQ